MEGRVNVFFTENGSTIQTYKYRMNRNIKSILILLIAVAVPIACSNHEEDGNIRDLSISNVSISSCNTEVKAASNSATFDVFDGERLEEYIEYAISPDGKVSFKHANVMVDCCQDNVKVIASLQGRQINVVESRDNSLCNCLCMRDISFQLGHLEKGEYVINVYEGSELGASFTLTYPISGKYIIRAW